MEKGSTKKHEEDELGENGGCNRECVIFLPENHRKRLSKAGPMFLYVWIRSWFKCLIHAYTLPVLWSYG